MKTKIGLFIIFLFLFSGGVVRADFGFQGSLSGESLIDYQKLSLNDLDNLKENERLWFYRGFIMATWFWESAAKDPNYRELIFSYLPVNEQALSEFIKELSYDLKYRFRPAITYLTFGWIYLRPTLRP